MPDTRPSATTDGLGLHLGGLARRGQGLRRGNECCDGDSRRQAAEKLSQWNPPYRMAGRLAARQGRRKGAI